MEGDQATQRSVVMRRSRLVQSTEMITDDVLARLLTFPNVLVTSHQAFFTQEALHNIAEITLDNFKEFFEGGYLKNEVCYICDKPCLKKQGKRCF